MARKDQEKKIELGYEFAERKVLSAVYELGDGKPALISYDKVAAYLEITMTGVQSISMLLQLDKYALVTFGGVQLTESGLEQARRDNEINPD